MVPKVAHRAESLWSATVAEGNRVSNNAETDTALKIVPAPSDIEARMETVRKAWQNFLDAADCVNIDGFCPVVFGIWNAKTSNWSQRDLDVYNADPELAWLKEHEMIGICIAI